MSSVAVQSKVWNVFCQLLIVLILTAIICESLLLGLLTETDYFGIGKYVTSYRIWSVIIIALSLYTGSRLRFNLREMLPFLFFAVPVFTACKWLATLCLGFSFPYLTTVPKDIESDIPLVHSARCEIIREVNSGLRTKWNDLVIGDGYLSWRFAAATGYQADFVCIGPGFLDRPEWYKDSELQTIPGKLLFPPLTIVECTLNLIFLGGLPFLLVLFVAHRLDFLNGLLPKE